MSYKIEKGIPLPTKNSWNSDPYPWKELEVGDSFLVDEPEDLELLRDRVWASFMRFKRQNKISIGLRTTKTEQGLRVWRTR